MVYQHDDDGTNNNKANNNHKGANNEADQPSPYKEANKEANKQTFSSHEEADRNFYVDASLVLDC